MLKILLLVAMVVNAVNVTRSEETFPPLEKNLAPKSLSEMWGDFDPQAEDLETEVVKEWEQDDVLLRIVRFRVGVFKGQISKIAAVYGFPKGGSKLPGLVQIHGGGQYANQNACLMNAKRGYATVSIAWAGRISASEYRVGPNEVNLFWDNKTDDPNYKLTTDWGAVDAYHAPCRNSKNQFPSTKAWPWTLDEVESPRNSSWFLAAVAARRALTFLERQPEVDATRLGVYGHSMGGKLTVMTSIDERVKAAAPSCGGISDRDNSSELFKKTIGDNNSLEEIRCPIIFLSPANDFHGRIGDVPKAIDEIKSTDWRVISAPHHNHQDTAPYEVATLLWFDDRLKGEFTFPETPATELRLATSDHIPQVVVTPDLSREVLSVDVFYTQHGKPIEISADRNNTVNRFWRHAVSSRSGDSWQASLPLTTTTKPVWIYANITYGLDEPVSGAGYYYGTYKTDMFNVSSLLQTASPTQLESAGVDATLEPTQMIESFDDGWREEWFSYKPESWPRATHKVYDEQYQAPPAAKLAIEVHAKEPNQLVVLIDGYAAQVDITGDEPWQVVVLSLTDFRNQAGEALLTWEGIRELKLSDIERLKSPGGAKKSLMVGKKWRGTAPKFRNMRWITKN